MNRMTMFLLGAGAIALAACSGGDDADDLAVNATENASASMADPNNPFGQVEMQMNERMTAAVGANASETWVRKMIEHHRGAVAMSQVLIDGGGDEDFVQMARTTVEKQQREIGELERMLSGGITGGSGEANPYGRVEQSMHQQMMAATGANPSETWARKMIAHHQGAVEMSEVLIRQGGNPQVVAMARRTADDQRREIAHLEAMLRGEAMPAAEPAAPAAGPTPDASAKESPRATPTPAAREPESAPKATPAPRPAPTPELAPGETCAPEHRAAGHC